MLLIIKFFAKILSLLNSEISPRQIAYGFAYGFLIGLIPVGSLFPIVLLLLGLIINFNLAAMFVAAAIFKIVSFFIDPLANQVGYTILTSIPSMKPFFTSLYNMPIIPLTRFNNTIVMGSFVMGIILTIPVYFLAKWGVLAYRNRYRERILKWRIVQVFKASTFYRWYETFQGIRGDG